MAVLEHQTCRKRLATSMRSFSMENFLGNIVWLKSWFFEISDVYFLCFYVIICVTVTELGTLEDRPKLGASGRRPRRGFSIFKIRSKNKIELEKNEINENRRNWAFLPSVPIERSYRAFLPSVPTERSYRAFLTVELPGGLRPPDPPASEIWEGSALPNFRSTGTRKSGGIWCWMDVSIRLQYYIL